MVLSNKKLKQQIREAKTQLFIASESQNTSNPNLENPASIAQESVQSLLNISTQQPRLSKREKQREKSASLAETEFRSVEEFGDDCETGVFMESRNQNSNKRKRGDVKVVKGDKISKKKKRNKRRKKKKVDNGDFKKVDLTRGVAGNGENVVAETIIGNVYESTENLDPCTKVYVGGIPFYSSEDDIRSYFEGCGTITEIDCMKFPESGKFRGIAIMTFKTEAAAKRADRTCKGGLYLKIQPYKSERAANKAMPFTPAIVEGYNRIYAGNLSWEITEDDLRHLFSDCTITSVRFGIDKETFEFKGYGHVDFADTESVKTALKLDQRVVCGRPIRISCAVANKGAVNGSTPSQQKTMTNQLKSEDSKPLEQNTNTYQPYSHVTNEVVAPVPDSSKIRRRTCYECGEKGHLSSACPKKKETDQANPFTISDPLKSEESKPLEQNTNTYQPYSNGTNEVAPVPDSSKIRRRTCYECGEKGHLSSACPKKQATDQANPVTISTQLKSQDSKSLEQNTNTSPPNKNGTNEIAPLPICSKIRRRTCYECGEKGHLSSACPKNQPPDEPNPFTNENKLLVCH